MEIEHDTLGVNGCQLNEVELDEREAEEQAVELPAQAPLASVGPGPSWLRLAYAVEFLVALIAIISVWGEVAGEAHLDLMPWHIKLICIVGFAWCSVRFTASMVERPKFWTGRTIGWLACVLLCCIAMAGITYYYHLQEEPDEVDQDSSTASRSISDPRTFAG